MPKIITLNNTEFEIPNVNDENYGEQLSLYLEELSVVINSISAPLDVPKTDFNFANNNPTPTDVTALVFPTSDVTSFEIDYVVSRVAGLESITERGKLLGYQSSSGWELSRVDVTNDVTNAVFSGSNGNIGITFSITGAGQVQYTSNNFPGQTAGLISFKARTITQD